MESLLLGFQPGLGRAAGVERRIGIVCTMTQIVVIMACFVKPERR
jgi:hypothetical protein